MFNLAAAVVGAVVGGVVAAAATVIIAKVRGSHLSTGMVVGSFVGGALMGAMAGTTLGMSLMMGGGVQAFGGLAATGAASSAIGQVTENAIDDRPITENVAKSAAIGAVAMPLTYGAIGLLGKVVPKAIAGAVAKLPESVRMPLSMPMIMPPMRRGIAAGAMGHGARGSASHDESPPSRGMVGAMEDEATPEPAPAHGSTHP